MTKKIRKVRVVVEDFDGNEEVVAEEIDNSGNMRKMPLDVAEMLSRSFPSLERRSD